MPLGKTYSSKRRFGAGSSLGVGSDRGGFCGWEVEGVAEVVSMVEGPGETRLGCVRGAATGGETVGGGGGGGESGFRGATLKPGPNVKGDCVFKVESPRDGSQLLEGLLCVDVEGPADMILLSAVGRTGRFEVGEEVGESLHPSSA
jgi:hypothetical protein